jgi:hypothetical protein
MQYFAIQQPKTGAFLPAFGRRRGHTYAEPSVTHPPRLFRTRRHAETALRWWVQGTWQEIIPQDREGHYYRDMEVSIKPGRAAMNMQVVCLDLVVK